MFVHHNILEYFPGNSTIVEPQLYLGSGLLTILLTPKAASLWVVFMDAALKIITIDNYDKIKSSFPFYVI